MMVISHIFHDDMMVIRPYINHDLWVITIIYGPFILLVTQWTSCWAEERVSILIKGILEGQPLKRRPLKSVSCYAQNPGDIVGWIDTVCISNLVSQIEIGHL